MSPGWQTQISYPLILLVFVLVGVVADVIDRKTNISALQEMIVSQRMSIIYRIRQQWQRQPAHMISIHWMKHG